MNKLQNSEPSAKIPSSPLNMSNVLINKILQEFSGQNGTKRDKYGTQSFAP